MKEQDQPVISEQLRTMTFALFNELSTLDEDLIVRFDSPRRYLEHALAVQGVQISEEQKLLVLQCIQKNLKLLQEKRQ